MIEDEIKNLGKEETELEIKKQELLKLGKENKLPPILNFLSNPFLLAVLGGLLTIIITNVQTCNNQQMQLELEEKKFVSELIFNSIDEDHEKTKSNLKFFTDLQLITGERGDSLLRILNNEKLANQLIPKKEVGCLKRKIAYLKFHNHFNKNMFVILIEIEKSIVPSGHEVLANRKNDIREISSGIYIIKIYDIDTYDMKGDKLQQIYIDVLRAKKYENKLLSLDTIQTAPCEEYEIDIK